MTRGRGNIVSLGRRAARNGNTVLGEGEPELGKGKSALREGDGHAEGTKGARYGLCVNNMETIQQLNTTREI